MYWSAEVTWGPTPLTCSFRSRQKNGVSGLHPSGRSRPRALATNPTFRPLTSWQDSPPSVNITPLEEIHAAEQSGRQLGRRCFLLVRAEGHHRINARRFPRRNIPRPGGNGDKQRSYPDKCDGIAGGNTKQQAFQVERASSDFCVMLPNFL